MSDSKISECKVTNKGGTINIGNANADRIGGIAAITIGEGNIVNGSAVTPAE